MTTPSTTRRGFLATALAAASAGCSALPFVGDVAPPERVETQTDAVTARYRFDGALERPAVDGETVYATTASRDDSFLPSPFDPTSPGLVAALTPDGVEWHAETFAPATNRLRTSDRQVYGPFGHAGASERRLLRVGPDGTVWQTDAVDKSLAVLGFDRERVYTGTYNDAVTPFGGETVSAVDRTDGTTRWTAESGDTWNGVGVVLNGTLVVAVGGVATMAFATEDGTGRWSVEERYLGVGTGSSTDAPVVATVAERSDTPTIRGRSLDTGNERWHHDPTADGTFVVAGGTTAGSTVYVVEFDGFVLALDAVDGSVRWSRRFGESTRSAPVVAGDSLLVPGEETLYALDRATGETRWTASGGGGIDRVEAQGDRVVVGTRLDEHRWRIRSLSLADGTERWSFTEEARQVWTTVGDVVAVGTSAGFLSVVE